MTDNLRDWSKNGWIFGRHCWSGFTAKKKKRILKMLNQDFFRIIVCLLEYIGYIAQYYISARKKAHRERTEGNQKCLSGMWCNWKHWHQMKTIRLVIRDKLFIIKIFENIYKNLWVVVLIWIQYHHLRFQLFHFRFGHPWASG